MDPSACPVIPDQLDSKDLLGMLASRDSPASLEQRVPPVTRASLEPRANPVSKALRVLPVSKALPVHAALLGHRDLRDRPVPQGSPETLGLLARLGR